MSVAQLKAHIEFIINNLNLISMKYIFGERKNLSMNMWSLEVRLHFLLQWNIDTKQLFKS